MTYQEVLENARTCIGPFCKACPVCNGKACGNKVPGPGAKGTGTVAIQNYDAWQKICINMDTICENKPVDTTFELFGQTFKYPIFAGPVGAMKLHYGDKYDDQEYNSILVSACADAGIAAFTGDGTNPAVMEGATQAIKAAGVPLILKGIMRVKGALKAKEAGASAIVVSNHGGRVLDQCPPTAEVLPEIAEAVGKDMKIFVDGGIRSGVDILKALALGADAVLIGRPFVTAVYGGAEEGVLALAEKLSSELADAMAMCGVHSLSEITRDVVR